MLDKVKQLMEMKKQADQMKRALDALQVGHDEGRGIKVVVTASQNIVSLDIDQRLLDDGNKADLERELVRHLNGALRKSQMEAAHKMKELMPGFPGL